MARTKLYLDTGKTKKMMGEAIFSVCKTSSNRARIDRELDKSSNRLRAEFDAHAVTQEIAGGPEVRDNPSGTLGGYGGLFSFIGFTAGSDPLAPIRRIIAEQRFQIRKSNGVLKSGNVVTMILEGPVAKEIFDVTHMPWANGRSWARGIEQGISGMGQYLNTEYLAGWSGQGVQTKSPIARNGTQAASKFNNKPYISAMIAKATSEAVRSVTSGNLIS